MKRLVITESERSQIRGQHATQIPIDLNNVVISQWLSPDEKYVIFLDELYDLENKSKLGDIWKSPDNLILFLEHSFRVSKLKREIKEHASEVFGKVLLSENKQDLTHLKPFIKEFLVSEGWLGDAWNTTKKIGSAALNYGGKFVKSMVDDPVGTTSKALNYAGKYIKDTTVDAIQGVGQFGQDLVKGGIDIGKAILSGDWEEVLNLMKQGTKWLARKIRSAVYHPWGIIIDTILVATGVGKVAQAVVWAIVVSLDIYEFVTGDYEHNDEPMWLRIIFFLIDILGLVSAGAAAGGARAVFKGIGSMLSLEKAAARSATMRETLTSLLKGLKKLPSKLAGWAATLSKSSFGKLFKMALDNVGKFINFIIENIKSTWKSPALKPVLVNAGLITGIGTTIEAVKDDMKKENEKAKKLAIKQKEEEDKAQEELSKEIINKHTDMSSAL